MKIEFIYGDHSDKYDESYDITIKVNDVQCFYVSDGESEDLILEINEVNE